MLKMIEQYSDVGVGRNCEECLQKHFANRLRKDNKISKVKAEIPLNIYAKIENYPKQVMKSFLKSIVV